MEKWFEEKLEVEEGRVLKVRYKKLLKSVKSVFQKIDVYETDAFGKMLVHDEVIMLTEFDESHYHEMIVHPALLTHPNPEKVLIIGGGDGGTMREVLKHKEVKEAHLCEIDKMVVDVCKEFFPNLSKSFDDKRAKLFFEDGAKFVEQRKDYYDVIIVDSSDPIGPAEVLFQEKFYNDMFNSLKDDGIVITQSESFIYHKDIIENIASFSKRIFPYYSYYYTLVPTYPSGLIGFSFCSKKYDPLKDLNEERIKDLGNLKYYNKGIHYSAFNLPNSWKF